MLRCLTILGPVLILPPSPIGYSPARPIQAGHDRTSTYTFLLAAPVSVTVHIK